jgi:uncharacterized HAD superfamily protein
MRNIIFDIDGTLSDPSQRLHFLENKDWDSFYEHCDEDPVISHVSFLAQELSKVHRIFILTGRPERVRKKTQKWLMEHYIPYDRLLMRKDGDHRPDYIIKAEMVDSLKLPIWLAIDDRDRVVKMFRDKGILCLQCREGDY